MKIRQCVFLLLFTIITFHAYSGGGSEKKETAQVDGLDISARGAIGRLETAASGPMWTGDGGRNLRLAIMAPEVQGDVPLYLPVYIQGLLNNNFGRFSAVNLIDRQNLDRIISEQNIASSGRYSDRDFVRIGNLINAQFFLFGTIQKLSGNRFSLQLSVTESSTGVRRATFMKEGTLAQLEGRASLINEASAELLTQLGVQLTEAGRRDLLAGNTSTVQAQTELAKGITAQAGGSEIEALFNFAQAVSFDPTQLEALSRLNTLSTTISGGTISQRITNDIQARDRWLEAFKETTRFFNEHPPFEIIFDPNLIQIGETDFARRTATLGMRIALDPSKAGFDALNALLGGLEKTGRREAWGFSGWPLLDITPRVSGTVVFGGKRSFSYKVDVALVNENGKRIGNGSVTLNSEISRFSSGDRSVIIPVNVDDVVRFQNIKAEDLTPTLTIIIVAVNGISSRNLAVTGYMRVETGDLEIREIERKILDSAERIIGEIHSVVFSPDCRYFLSGSSDNTVKLWYTQTGRLIRILTGHRDEVYSVAFSPDGRLIVSGSGDNTIKLWDTYTGELIRTFLGHRDGVSSVTFSPDGRQIVSGSRDNTIKLWETNTGRLIRTFSGHISGVRDVKFTLNGKQLISGSLYGTTEVNNPRNFIKLWDIATGNEIRSFTGEGGYCESITVRDDGYFVSGATWGGTVSIHLWDINTGRKIRSFNDGGIETVCFNPDGSRLISGNASGDIKLWDVNTGREIRTFSGKGYGVNSVSFSSDGRYIISSHTDCTIKLWNADNGRLIRTIGTAETREFL